MCAVKPFAIPCHASFVHDYYLFHLASAFTSLLYTLVYFLIFLHLFSCLIFRFLISPFLLQLPLCRLFHCSLLFFKLFSLLSPLHFNSPLLFFLSFPRYESNCSREGWDTLTILLHSNNSLTLLQFILHLFLAKPLLLVSVFTSTSTLWS